MLPKITITDAPTARIIAQALRAQADASRRTADRLGSPAYAAVSGANVRNAARLIAHAARLDALAVECDREGDEAEADDYSTDVLPLFTMDETRRIPAVVTA